MRPLLITLGATVVVLALPLASAGACISGMDLGVGVGTVHFDMQQVFEDEDAADFRTLVDQSVGNRDGSVEDGELAAWRSAMTDGGELPVDACRRIWVSVLFGVGVEQGGDAPSVLHAYDTAMDVQGAREADSGSPLIIRFTGTFGFDVDGDETIVAVFPEGFEGLSEMMECLAPDPLDRNFAQHPCGEREGDPLAAMHRLSMRPLDDARIDETSIEPFLARSSFDGTAIVMDDFVFDDDRIPEIRFQVVQEPDSEIPWTILIIGGLTGLGAVAVWRFEWARFRFWWLFSIIGFTRIRRGKALDHRRRESILAAIESEPGVHLGALQRGLDMATGSLVHHLRVLQHAGFVEVHRRANRVHFVPAGYSGQIETSHSALQERLLETVRSHPGLSQSELAERLAAPRNTVAYNLRRLQAQGYLEAQREGRAVRHFVAGEETGRQ